MIAPKTISHYPWAVVRIECVLCSRKGAYKLARLTARYGPDRSLDGLLAELAHDCPRWGSKPRKHEPRCGAQFIDLERNTPPPDMPSGVIFRQRGPEREDVPRRRSIVRSGSTAVPTLAGWPAPLLTITCTRCGLHLDWTKAELLAVNGDVRLTDLLIRLTASCPRRQETSVYEQCGARYAMGTHDHGHLTIERADASDSSAVDRRPDAVIRTSD